MAELDVKDVHDVDVELKAVNAAGKVGTSAAETWSSSDQNIATVEARGKGKAHVTVHSLGRVDIIADAKDEDGLPITATLTLNVVPGDAPGVTIDATVVPKDQPK